MCMDEVCCHTSIMKSGLLLHVSLVFSLSIILIQTCQSAVLSRKRRHLIFPKGSNFIVMLTQTRTLPFAKTPPWFTRLLPIWQGLIEFELRFPLPPDSLRKLSSPPPPSPPSTSPSATPTSFPFWPTPPQAESPTPLAGSFPWQVETPHDLPFEWQYPTRRREWDGRRPEMQSQRWHSNRHRRDRRRLHGAVADLLHANGLDGGACVRRARCEAAFPAAPKMEEEAAADEDKGDEEIERSLFDDFLRLLFFMPQKNKTAIENCADINEECPFSLLEAYDFEFS